MVESGTSNTFIAFEVPKIYQRYCVNVVNVVAQLFYHILPWSRALGLDYCTDGR